jgi:hypothetical protein
MISSRDTQSRDVFHFFPFSPLILSSLALKGMTRYHKTNNVPSSLFIPLHIPIISKQARNPLCNALSPILSKGAAPLHSPTFPSLSAASVAFTIRHARPP